MPVQVITEAFVQCSYCNAKLKQPTDGVILRGSIYVASATEWGGLLGGSDGKSEDAYCWKCLLQGLGWGQNGHSPLTCEEAMNVVAKVYGRKEARLNGNNQS